MMTSKINPKNIESVKKFLREDLAYCNCSSALTLELLYLTLTFARDIPHTSSKIRKSGFFTLGFGEWFIYLLESKELIWHGFNSTDFAINELGNQLLQGLENFRTELGISDAILNNLAYAYLNMGLYDNAAQMIETYIQQCPHKAIGYHTQSEILFAFKKYEQALVSITKSIELEDSKAKQRLKRDIEEHLNK